MTNFVHSEIKQRVENRKRIEGSYSSYSFLRSNIPTSSERSHLNLHKLLQWMEHFNLDHASLVRRKDGLKRL